MTCELHHYAMTDSQTSACTRCGHTITNPLRDRPCSRDPKRGCRFGACCLDVEKGAPDPSEWVDVGTLEARDKDGAKIVKPRLVRREHVRDGEAARDLVVKL